MNKNLRRQVLAALLCGVTTAATAQVSFGPKAGIGLATVHINLQQGAAPSAKVIAVPVVGLTMNINLGDLALQPSVLYAQKGYAVESKAYGRTIKGSERLDYLEIPLHLVYTAGGDHGIQLFFGPYVGIGLGGNIHQESGSDQQDVDVEFKTDIDGNDLRSGHDFVNTPDAGVDMGMGYRSPAFQMQVEYNLGLNTLVPTYNGTTSENTIYNRGVRLTFAYFLNAHKD